MIANTNSSTQAKNRKYLLTPRQYFAECLHPGKIILIPSKAADITTAIPATIIHSPTENGKLPVILP